MGQPLSLPNVHIMALSVKVFKTGREKAAKGLMEVFELLPEMEQSV